MSNQFFFGGFVPNNRIVEIPTTVCNIIQVPSVPVVSSSLKVTCLSWNDHISEMRVPRVPRDRRTPVRVQPPRGLRSSHLTLESLLVRHGPLRRHGRRTRTRSTKPRRCVLLEDHPPLPPALFLQMLTWGRKEGGSTRSLTRCSQSSNQCWEGTSGKAFTDLNWTTEQWLNYQNLESILDLLPQIHCKLI